MITDIIEKFKTAMATNGVICDSEIIGDGNIHRFHIDGDKSKSKNGWLVLHIDGLPAGAFGSWKTGISHTWCIKSKSEMTLCEWRQYCHRIKQANEKRKQIQAELYLIAAKRANYLWNLATDANIHHPYLLKKRVTSQGIRQLNDLLLIPLVDVQNNLHNLQIISPNGSKNFLSGGRVKGLFCLIKKFPTRGRLYICEGWATGMSIKAITGHPVVAAMNAENLKSVALALKQFLSPEVSFVIAADNDHNTLNNPGLAKGREAAESIGAALTWPRLTCNNCNCTDFNDLYNCENLQRGVV